MLTQGPKGRKEPLVQKQAAGHKVCSYIGGRGKVEEWSQATGIKARVEHGPFILFYFFFKVGSSLVRSPAPLMVTLTVT